MGMADVLQKILATKRVEIEAAERVISRTAIVGAAAAGAAPRDFVGAVRSKMAAGSAQVSGAERAAVIQKSPSMGVRKHF